MRINHNISALKANNQLAKTNKTLDKSLGKLSSGYRINSAADDSAGLAISEKMRTQISGLGQASRNASDGISVIQTAEGALSEVESMLQRMRELSVQSANGTYTTSDRVAIQSEIDQLNKEIDRISDTTEFNTMTLLDGNIDRKSFSNNNNVNLVSLSDTVDAGNYKVEITQDARQAVVLGAQSGFPDGDLPKDTIVKASEVGKVNINGVSIIVKENDTLDDVFTKLRDAGDSVGVKVFGVDKDTDDTKINVASYPDNAGYENVSWVGLGRLAFVSNEYGSSQKIELYCDNPNLSKLLGLSTSKVSAVGVDATATVTPSSTDATSNFNNTATLSIQGNKVAVSDRDNFEMVVEIKPGTAKTAFKDITIKPDNATTTTASLSGGSTQKVTLSVLEAGPMNLQIGANEDQTMTVRIPKVNSKTLNIDKINMATAEGAQKAISLIDTAINNVSAIRSKLGAYQNRLEHSISNLDTASENMTESLSRIADVDMAEEMAEYTQKNVLAQAGTSMLSQANKRPQTILGLLQQG